MGRKHKFSLKSKEAYATLKLRFFLLYNTDKGDTMKKQWMKLCALVLAMSLLVMGGAGCSDGKIFGIQVGDNADSDQTDAGDYDNLQDGIKYKYPIPEPIKSPEEIENSGEEITSEDVMNAFSYLSYCMTKEMFKGAEELVSSEFVSIIPHRFLIRNDNDELEKYSLDYYFKAHRKNIYPATIVFNNDVAGMDIPIEGMCYFPEEFGEFLEMISDESQKVVVDDQYLSEHPLKYFYHEKGDVLYFIPDFTPEFIMSIENPEARKKILEILYNTCNNLEDFNNPNKETVPWVEPEIEG